MSHSTCTHWGQVDSRLLMVGSQTANLTPCPSFCHNLCYRCPNGSCKPIFDIYTLIVFQWYKERLNARCFDSCNRTLKFQESHRTPKSPFRECESHPHTLSNRVATKKMKPLRLWGFVKHNTLHTHWWWFHFYIKCWVHHHPWLGNPILKNIFTIGRHWTFINNIGIHSHLHSFWGWNIITSNCEHLDIWLFDYR